MFNSTIIDVAIGLVFVYLLLSLICSAANEIIELWLKNRAADLEKGIRELFNDRERTTGMVQKIYSHPLVSGLFEKPYDAGRLTWIRRLFGRVNLPSYIPARNFALALMDIKFETGDAKTNQPQPSAPGSSGAAGATPPSSSTPQIVVNMQSTAPAAAPATSPLLALRENIQTLPNESARTALTALIDAAGDDAAKARENIENWYNSSMDRVSGWYKRRTQVFVLIIGFFVAIAVNADSIVIAKHLWSDKPLRESLVAAADAYAKANANATPSATPITKPGAGGSPPAATPTPAPTPTATPTPTPTPNPAAQPTPCWQAACAAREDSEECQRKKTECTRAACSAEACPEGKEDTPQCKLKQAKCEIEGLGLPIGWKAEEWPGLAFWKYPNLPKHWAEQLKLHFFGWLLTALAISLGAPFWFDLLNKFIVVRSTVKPKEKSAEEKSKD